MAAILNVLNKKILAIGILTCVIFLNACKDLDKNNSLIFEELNESLENSNQEIQQNIYYSLFKLEDLAKKVETAQWSMRLLPKAKMIQYYSSNIITFIDSLSTILRNQISLDSGIIHKDGGKYIVTDLFIGQNESQRLYKKLNSYRTDVLNIDEYIKKIFSKKIPISDEEFKNRIQNENQFTNVYFNNVTASEALVILSKFKNDILVSESQTIFYLRSNIAVDEVVYDKFSPITTQNSTHFKMGEVLIIQTGIGAFTVNNDPRFFINDKEVRADGGVAVYKMKIKTERGKYKIPVKIELTNQDGSKRSISENIEYTVDK